MTKPILCLDFDGVLHSYASGWKGAGVIPDAAVPGALDFLAEAVKHFTVAIYSSRSHQEGGIAAMQNWLWQQYGAPSGVHEVMDALQWPTSKPPALVTLDDRAIRFTGTWPTMGELHSFKPWNK